MRLLRAGLVRDVVVLFVMLVAMLAVSAPRSVRADSSSELDGVGHTVACGGFACSQLITTTQNDDVIILIAESQSTSQSVIDGAGLSFVQRLSFAPSTNPYLRIWEYYAVARSPLSNDNITVVEQSGFPKDGIQVLAIHGAATTQIFDNNPSVPATMSCPGSGCGDCTANSNQGTCSASIDTSSADFVIATTGINDADPCGASSTSTGQPPPGFTNVTFWNGEFEVDYALASGGSQVLFSCSGTDAGGIVLDAISLSAASGGSPAPNDPSQSPLGLDGNGACTISVCSASWELLTTTRGNDIVIVFASCSDCQITDTAGLGFSFRAGVGQLQGGWSEYYAIARTPLDSDNITVSSANIHVLAVHGYMLGLFDASPFTSNCAYADSQQTPCTGSASTSGTAFIYTGVYKPATSCDNVTGWTRIENSYLITSDYLVQQQPGTTSVSYNCLHYNRIGPPNHEVLGLIVDAIALPDPALSYSLTWQGYDWDGAGEETLSLNGQFLASLPANDTPANGGAWASFALDITQMVVNGTNTLTFSHAPWDCSVSDDVSNLQVTGGRTVIYSNPNESPLSCAQTLTYTFTI